MVPEWFRNPILVDIPKWFRNGSGSVPCIAEDMFGEDPITSVLRARIGVALSVVLRSDSG